MTLVYLLTAAVALGGAFYFRGRLRQRESDRRSITPDALHALLEKHQDVLVYDVRLPLDVLTDSEIIPGARRVPPKDVERDPSLIPRDRDVVVYCTCPSDETSRAIQERARKLNFFRVKFLRGGLEGWKQRGYPVEPYRETFHLDTAT